MATTPKVETQDLVHPEADGFIERVTPKLPDETIHFYKCGNCGHTHFRHAGYVKTMLPFMRSGDEKRIGLESYEVNICVKCRTSFAWINEQVYDVSDQVDVQAWEKAEKELHRATGPGGQC